MKNLCILYDEYFLLHQPDFFHAENPSRLKAILDYIGENELPGKPDYISPVKASKEQITAVHSEALYDYVKSSVENGKRMLDPDTYINKYSFDAALLAAGSLINASDLVLSGDYKNAFCAVRPPGHHATRSRSMGFCLFNNIAVGVQHAIADHKKNRIAIVDWDVHHGNGTQDIFYETDKVLFISLHQHPLYPGTGLQFETGSGAGKGFTLNFPLPPGTPGRIYIKLFEEEITARLNEYDPEMLFISAGFDAHREDPLAGMNLTTQDYGVITQILKTFADQKNIPVISALEGGYNLSALSQSVYEHLQILSS